MSLNVLLHDRLLSQSQVELLNLSVVVVAGELVALKTVERFEGFQFVVELFQSFDSASAAIQVREGSVLAH